MLVSLKLKNFRQHEDRTIDFTPGLNVLRGVNEAGKSGILEAISYVMFGVKACRTSFADMVTWGRAEGTLKVELVLRLENVDYTITRSKSGAEANFGSDKVVGQAEVSQFVARLLGTSPNTVNRLMMSGQGDIRGALGEGTVRTSQLIEQLSNFSILDDIITAIGEDLVTGAEAQFVAKVEAAVAEVEASVVTIEKPDVAAQLVRLDWLERSAAEALAATGAARAVVVPLAQERDRLTAVIKKIDDGSARHAELERMAVEAGTEVFTVVIPPAPDTDTVKELEADLAYEKATAKRRAVRAQMEALFLPDVHWEGTEADFYAERAAVRNKMEKANTISVESKGLIQLWEARRVTGSACGYCGKDVSALPEVVAKNQTAAEGIASATAAMVAAKAEFDNLSQDLKALNEVDEAGEEFMALAARYPDLIERVDTTYPPTLKWVGGDTAEHALPDLLLKLSTLKQQERDHIAASSKVATLRTTVLKLTAQATEVALAINPLLPERDKLPGVLEQLKASSDTEAAHFQTHYAAREEALKLGATVKDALRDWEAATARREGAEKRLKEAREDLEQIVFNNGLLKKVRAARPAIGNKLWGMVLAAVSTYFSAMRGTPSVVTKDEDGFKVDGHVIEGLSGSALDILGLAIRYALVHTFLPSSPFVVLDEPAAACNEARTERMLAFLVTSGFKQTLLVTHEDLSETVADNLITL